MASSKRKYAASGSSRKDMKKVKSAGDVSGDLYELDSDEEGVTREEARNQRALDREEQFAGVSGDPNLSDLEFNEDDDDEEIDSDEAFDSEDERKYGDFDFGRRGKKGGKSRGDDGEEDEEVDEEEEDNYSTSEEEEEDSEDEERHREMLRSLREARESEEDAKKDRTGGPVAPRVEAESAEETLTLSDMVGSWKDSEGKTTSRDRKLEKSLKRLTPTAAPLPKVVQERNERKAAYSISSKDVSKWQNIVKANREARTIEFSNRQTTNLQVVSTTSALANNFKPENEMEREIAELLKQEIDKDKIQEDLPSNDLSKEERKERQAKLAKMRSVLFYHDQKAKKLKAIKSKRHHKYLKNVEKRRIEKEGIDIDPETLKKEMEHAEYLRARERLTLKHKNTSKWAKRALQRGFQRLDDNTKLALSEQNQISESLKRKVNYQEESEDDSSSDEEIDDVEGNEENKVTQKINNKAKAEVLKLLEENPDAEVPKKGLFSLPFMARAINKQKEAARQKAEDFLMELENDDDDSADDLADSKSDEKDSGKISFGGKANKTNRHHKEQDEEEDEDEEGSSEGEPTNDDQGDGPGKQDKGEKRGTVKLNYGHTLLSTSRIQGDSLQSSDLDLPKGKAKETKPRGKRASKGKGAQKEDVQEMEEEDEYLDAEEEGNEGPHLSQRQIVSQAFGAFGDDVQADFQEEKVQNLADELPTFEEPADLPGWGKWEGERKTPKWILKAREKAQDQRKEALASRKDKKLKHVVISERYDKKASKYATTSVPYPFMKKEDYEGSIRTPLGSDFNSEKSHRDLTRPEVLTTTGVRIDPISFTKSNSHPKKDSSLSGVRKV